MESARQNSQQNSDLKRKKKKFSRRWLFLLILAVPIAAVLILAAMLFQVPADYAPPENIDTAGPSRYLTNQILPTVYNRAQLNEPFELTITQQAVNDIFYKSGLLGLLSNLGFEKPVIVFRESEAAFMAKRSTSGLEVVASVELQPGRAGPSRGNACRIFAGSTKERDSPARN